jgi:hypothetical protein
MPLPSFDFLPLLWWGLPFVAAPLVIHLINLLRYRRVRFAALEFLLASQRKYRSRVLLKQLLLLLLRTAAILGIVLALAQPRWQTSLGAFLGVGRTLHVVLLDDSFSMGDATPEGQGAAESGFDRGRRVVERIAAELAGGNGVQEFALGRYSTLATGTAGAGFDLDRQPLTPQLMQQVRDALADAPPSFGDQTPLEPLRRAADLLTAGGEAGRVLWLVSDFRAKDWRRADDAAAVLRQLADAGVELRLVDCAAAGAAAEQAANLTIERLELAGGVPATGVLVPIEVAVRNDGETPRRDVAVELREDGVARPGLRIEEIPAGGVATRRFEARFMKAGGHVVEARIPADVLGADNRRTATVDVVDRVEVLLIDGDPQGSGTAGDAFYVAAALAPGAGAPTGLRPRIEPPRALTTLDLTTFDCVWVLDVERLDQPEIAALEAYARAGGGVVFFAGPRTQADVVNRTLYRDGEGLFPVPLAGPVDLLPDANAADPVPDLVAEEHPAVAVLSGQRNPLLGAVRIERTMAVDRGFDAANAAGLRRLLSLRNGAALMVERPFGDGLVVGVLTTAAPVWNNWARGNPSWVVVLLELESHLARVRRRAAALEVGDAIVVRLEQGVDEIEVDFSLPPDGTLVRQTAVAAPGGVLEARLPAAVEPGGYAARWRRLDGTEQERLFAVNVDPVEGRLERAGREPLDRTLAGVAFRYDRAESLQPQAGSLAGVSLVRPLLHMLLAVLVAEQLLALWASYHAPRGPAAGMMGRR